ncbi:MAG: response regulator [Bacteroidales bacterium]|jgi:CheY-like chemotaxis protein|nr:response regulator [Bacteroidales bacterium]
MSDKLIFFVDDDPMFINLLEYTFKGKTGYVSKAFATGEECVEHLHLNPSLVVVDFHLDNSPPEMTGLDVVRAIKRQQPSLPVIILSGNNDKATIDDCMRAGATGYIVKDGYFIDHLTESIFKILP